MIELRVKEYCHDCPDFEPKVGKNTLSFFNVDRLETIERTNTVITCQYHGRCASQMEYLKQMAHKEDEKND